MRASKPIIVTAIKINPAKANVTIRWLVTVKVQGINPIKLQKKINMNKENMKGKKDLPWSPT